MLCEEHVAKRHDPRLHHLVFGWSFVEPDTHQESVLTFNWTLNVRAASLANSPRAFSRPSSCCSVARVGWSPRYRDTIGLERGAADCPQFHGTRIFKSFHVRWEVSVSLNMSCFASTKKSCNNWSMCRIRHGVSFGVCRPPDRHLGVQVAGCLMDGLCHVVAVRATSIL